MNRKFLTIAVLAITASAELQPNHGTLCNEFTGSPGFSFSSNSECINAAGCSPIRTSTLVCSSAAKEERKLCDTVVLAYNAAFAAQSSATKCETKDGKTTVVVTTQFSGAIPACKETTSADIKADVAKFVTSVACNAAPASGGNGGDGSGSGNNGNNGGAGNAGSGNGAAGSGAAGGSGNGNSGSGSGSNSTTNSTLNNRVAKSNDASSLTMGSLIVALFAALLH